MMLESICKGRKLYNYKIENGFNQDNICMIYFSSNNIYFPDTEEAFQEIIIEKDRYEWENIAKKIHTTKKIFVRDIYKSWYIKGINEVVNTIEKLTELLINETCGYRVITVGNSAGGYCAILIGIKLKAEHILVFSPQNNLKIYPAYWKCPCLSSVEKENNPYINLDFLLETYKGSIFYFYSSRCKDDIAQIQSLKHSPNLFLFQMKSKWHGKNIYSFNLPTLLGKTEIQLKQLYYFLQKKRKKEIEKWRFSFICDGFFKTIFGIIQQHYVRIIRRRT